MQVTTIGLDVAKRVFQIHGVEAAGAVVIRRKLRRSELLQFFAHLAPCLVGIEACATAHFWARELGAFGHQVRLVPPSYVKAYLKRGKNDAADAEAICEAVTRPNMRFVPVKTVEQQGVLVLHRARELLVRQRTMLVNGLRAHMAEFGIVVPQGIQRLPELVALLEDEKTGIPQIAHEVLAAMVVQINNLTTSIRQMEKRIVAWCRTNAAARRLSTIPGVGPITASALAATITDPTLFRSGRHLAAWLGLVPRQHSTGGKAKLGRITKMGDQYLRKLLIVGMTAVIRSARRTKAPAFAWVNALLERRPARLVSVALANKAARIAWAILIRGETYRAPAITAAA
ncbi:MAG: IS110 family transposase [Alphaproteobacteria bacterium]|nr:MAG: IS110 family transposase [Alphaproteobacteria bacterium]